MPRHRVPLTAVCWLLTALLLSGCMPAAPQFLPLPDTLPIVEPIADPLGSSPAATPETASPAETAGPASADSFAAWMETHKTTCAQCRRSMDESPDEPICLEAFRKLQAICGTVLEKPAEPQSPAKGGCADGQCGPQWFRPKPLFRWR